MLFVADYKVYSLRSFIELKAAMRDLNSSVEHLHYLYSRRNNDCGFEGERDNVDRLTQYIPCESLHDMHVLERKLSDNGTFNRHAVSDYFVPMCLVS